MSNQINTQAIIKKAFLNIFEISYLFDVSGITVRRHIKNILEKIALVGEKIRLSTQDDKALLTQELRDLLGKARKRVIGQTKEGESIYLLELSNREAFASWQLRPTIKAAIRETEKLPTQEPNQVSTQKNDLDNQNPKMINQKEGEPNNQEVAIGGYGQKYVQLLETQLSEKDDTIKDLRETNKFLSITNGKLNEQLRLLLEKPQEP